MLPSYGARACKAWWAVKQCNINMDEAGTRTKLQAKELKEIRRGHLLTSTVMSLKRKQMLASCCPHHHLQSGICKKDAWKIFMEWDDKDKIIRVLFDGDVEKN